MGPSTTMVGDSLTNETQRSLPVLTNLPYHLGDSEMIFVHLKGFLKFLCSEVLAKIKNLSTIFDAEFLTNVTLGGLILLLTLIGMAASLFLMWALFLDPLRIMLLVSFGKDSIFVFIGAILTIIIGTIIIMSWVNIFFWMHRCKTEYYNRLKEAEQILYRNF